MPTGQQYGTNVPQTTLVSGINASATAFQVASSSSWPSTPFTAVLEIGTTLQEPIDVTAVAGVNWTVTRNIDGTTGFSHGVGATITHADIGRDFRETRAHIDATGGNDTTGKAVHGTGSAVVGKDDTQTLTNKTLTSPVISTISNSGTLTLPTGPDTLVGRATTDTLTNKTISVGTYSGAQTMGSGTWTGTGSLVEASLSATGLTGATGGARLAGGVNIGGAPTSGTFVAGDIVRDGVSNILWVCTAGGSPGTWTVLGSRALLTSQTLLSSNTFSFNTIPSWVNHLEIYFQARGTGGTTGGIFTCGRVNGDSGNNYVYEVDFGQITTANAQNSGGAVAQFNMVVVPSNGDTANYFGSGFWTIRNIQATTQFKSFSGYGGGPSSTTNAASGTFAAQWNSTAAITRVDIFGAGGTTLAAGSNWQIYGCI